MSVWIRLWAQCTKEARQKNIPTTDMLLVLAHLIRLDCRERGNGAIF